MVESQRRQLILGEPAHIIAILEMRGLGLAYERPVHDGDHRQSTMGALWPAKGVQLLEVARMQRSS